MAAVAHRNLPRICSAGNASAVDRQAMVSTMLPSVLLEAFGALALALP